MKLLPLTACALSPLLLNQSTTQCAVSAQATSAVQRNPQTEARALRHSRPDFSALDPKGRRVNFFGDFFETPDAPPGGTHLERTLPTDHLHLQFVADTGSSDPKARDRVLQSMQADTDKKTTQARFLLGDLVYEAGVSGPRDPAIAERVAVFAPPHSNMETFAILGNHDLGKQKYALPDAYAYLDVAHPDHTTPKVAPTNTNTGISMVDRYYDVTFQAPNGSPVVQVILLDTNVLARDPAQKAWLEKTLAASTAPHVILAGHHPLKSAGPEHLTPPPFAKWLTDLVSKYHVSAMVFGHEHNLQARLSDALPPQFIVGAGSKMDYPPGSHHGKKTVVQHSKTDTITAFGEPGFGTLDANHTQADFSLLKAKKSHKTRTLFQETLAALPVRPAPLLRRASPTGQNTEHDAQRQEKRTAPDEHPAGMPWLAISAGAAGVIGLIHAARACQQWQPRQTEEEISLLPLVRRPESRTTYGSYEDAVTITV